MTLAVAEFGENTTICAKIFISIFNSPQMTNPKPKLRQPRLDTHIEMPTKRFGLKRYAKKVMTLAVAEFGENTTICAKILLHFNF